MSDSISQPLIRQEIIKDQENFDSIEYISRISQIDIIIQFLFKILKVFSLKSMLTLLIKRNLLFSCKFERLLQKILASSNFRFSIGISLISFIYKILVKSLTFYRNKLGMDDLSIKLISSFIASFASINMFDEASSRFYIIIILTRVSTNMISEILKKYNLFQSKSKFYDYLIFSTATITLCLGIFLNPDYKTLYKLVSKQSLHSPSETKEYNDLMQMTRLV